MNRAMMRSVIFMALCVAGKAQTQCSNPLDIIIAVDVSGSTNIAVFNQIQTFLNNLVSSFTISSNGGAQILVFAFDHVAQFSSVLRLDQPGAQTLAGVRDQINNMPFTQGATLIQQGLIEARNIFNTSSLRPNVPRVAVFITDGVNQGGNSSLIQPAEDLRTISNARVISLGLGPADNINENVLNVLAGTPNQVTILTLQKSSCADGEDDDDDDSDDSDDSSDDEDGSCSTEVSKTVSLICV